jgi:hypothetical protein
MGVRLQGCRGFIHADVAIEAESKDAEVDWSFRFEEVAYFFAFVFRLWRITFEPEVTVGIDFEREQEMGAHL